MRRAALAVLLLLAATCAPHDPLAAVKSDYPGASEYLRWQGYMLIRYPADEAEPGLRTGLLLKHEGKEWVEFARSDEGFAVARDVMTWIPELDESGVAAFGLH